MDCRRGTFAWHFTLANEQDADTMESVSGNGPLMAMVAGFMREVLRHRLFDEINGKLVFATSGECCRACTVHGAFVRKCKYYTPSTYDAIGKACQLAVCLGIRWEKPFSLMATAPLLGLSRYVSHEMVYDLYPLARQLQRDPFMYGPVRLDENGDALRFQLAGVIEPFAIPHTVPIGELFGVDSTACVPVRLLPHYLAEHIQKRMDLTKPYEERFRNSMLNMTSFWHVFGCLPVYTVSTLLGFPTTYVDPNALLEKINFYKGMDEHKIAMFKRIMAGDADLRSSFLRAVTESPQIPLNMPDKAIEVSMGPGDGKCEEYGGADVRVCFLTVRLPVCETEDEMRTALVSMGSLVDADLYNTK